MSVCKRGLVLVFVLDWTQCLPQRASAPPAMLRGCMTGFQKNWGLGPPKRHDKVDTICTVPLDCGTPTTRRLYPFGAYHLIILTIQQNDLEDNPCTKLRPPTNITNNTDRQQTHNTTE